MLKQKLMLMMLLLTVGVSTMLADGYRSVLVSMKSGDVAQINLSEGLTTTFSGTTVVFRSGSFRVSYPSSDIVGFTFDESVGIDGVKADANGMQWQDGTLVFSKLPNGAKVQVYGADGRCLISEQATEGTYTLHLNRLGAGNYLVKVNGMSHKITLGK
ncbi:MAG: T9SS type A sorting domain-containing protein [Bacteroidaceae bacterium]|nr:T9SS type A sorting domain-containing protein [Bacteroidaceae bacterium]